MSNARDMAGLSSVNDRLSEVGNSDGALSNRNLIINGAMQVAQRGTSAVAIGAPNFPSIDRFKCYKQSDGGTITTEQSAEAPDGFYYSMKATVTSADATPTGVNSISYWVEGSDAQHLGFGTASAQTCTISFWVKSSIAGTYSVVIQDNDYVVSYVAEYSISSPNSWEQKTVTFAGPTTGSWGKTSATSGVRIWWDMGSSDDSSTSTVNQWAERGFRSTSSVRLIETSGATWQITGVQLEVGDQSTPFEHRSYSDQLQSCQRYYYRRTSAGSSGSYYRYVTGFYTSTSAAEGVLEMPVEMRATPSLSSSGTFAAWDSEGVRSATDVALGSDGSSKQTVNVNISGISGGTRYRPAEILSSNSTSSYLELDAEL